MYKLNSNFLTKNNFFKSFISFLVVLIIIIYPLNISYGIEQNNNSLQDSTSNQISLSSGQIQIINPQKESSYELDDNELYESDITTKIYKSTDNSGEVLKDIEIELDPALDADVINKEELIEMQTSSPNKILHRGKTNFEAVVKKPLENIWLPWALFALILLVLFGLIKAIKKIKI